MGTYGHQVKEEHNISSIDGCADIGGEKDSNASTSGILQQTS
jgi:hypothetical protein